MICFVLFLCVLCFCIFCVLFLPIYIVIYFLFIYNFTDHCHQVETQLQLINIISYHKDRETKKYSEENQTQHHFVHHKFHTEE